MEETIQVAEWLASDLREMLGEAVNDEPEDEVDETFSELAGES